MRSAGAALRAACRVQLRQKGLSFAALLTLALGIGATTALFSIAYGVLLRPLPFVDHERVVRLSEAHAGAAPPLTGAWFSNYAYHAWQDARRTVGEIEIFSNGPMTVGEDRPDRMPGATVSPGLLEMLGARPAAGRFFVDADAADGAPPVVVVSDALWRERFGDAPFAPGRALMIDDQRHQVIGVLRPGFGFPADGVRLYTTRGEPPRTGIAVFGAVARLAPGATADQASAEGTGAARAVERPRVVDMLFGEGGPVEVRAVPFAEAVASNVRPALLTLVAGAFCLLLIACVNVANLLLSRGVSRERELAVRASLGATRGRLLGQLLAEGLVLALAGGVFGVLLAAALVRVLPAVAPADFPRLEGIAVDARALGVALAVSLAAGLLAGLAPAWRGARLRLASALREHTGSAGDGRMTRVRQMLLAGEAGVAVLLLIAAALVGRSFVALSQVDAGFDTTPVVSARVYLPGSSSGEADATGFLRDLLARLRARPDVEAAGAGSMAPFSPSTALASFTFTPPGREPVSARALVYVVTPGYAEAIGLRLRRGRLLAEADLSAARQPVVVNETFARTFLAGLDPVGLQFESLLARGGPSEIVGVVGDVLKDGLDRQPQPEAYVTTTHGYGIRREVNLLVRVRPGGDSGRLVSALRDEVHAVAPRAAVDRVDTLAGAVSGSLGRPRFAAAVLAGFAGLALVLAAVGLYGVLAYNVSRRRREIGIRRALGASRGRVIGMVVREGLTVSLAGLAAGVAAAAGLTRLLGSLLFGVTPLDGVAFAAAPVALVLVALAASWVPAWRAARTPPAIVLRGE